MELDAIAVFVKVVESGSFTGAAKLLKMPKTTVSAKIAALERRLGVTLIQRTTRKLHITDAGQRYFKHCAMAIAEIEKGESEIHSSQEKPQGLLKITAPTDLGHTVLPRIVSQYLKTYPDVQVELVVTNRIVDVVGEGFDLAVRAGELKDSTLISKRFFDLQVGLWASPAYLKKHGSPSHPKELSQHLLVGHTLMRPSSLDLTDGKNILSVAVQPRISVDDFETLKSLLILKEGIGLLPEFLVTRELGTKELTPVLDRWKHKTAGLFSFVYPGQKYSSPKVRAFIDLALKEV